LNAYSFHITLYGLAFTGAIFIGLTFALLLWFVKTVNRSANRFLSLALVTMILWMARLLVIDIGLHTHLPLQYLLALGPLMYFYVLKITRPQYKFAWQGLIHFSPLLLEQGLLPFQQLNLVLQLLIFISVITYLHQSYKLILHFYTRQPIVMMDRPRLEFRWLRRLLVATAMLWLAWITCAVIVYVGYGNQPGTQVYYPFYILFAVIIIWTAMAAFLKPQAAMIQTTAPVKPAPIPIELRAKGALLKKAMESHLYYQEPELSLGSLAGKLALHPHELSKIINTVFNKSFNDFINEYRVRDVISKMQGLAYDNMTLLGIAYEAGFNSQSTFNRIFKQFTGKSPQEYKTELKKEQPTYNLSSHSPVAPVISNYQAPPKWAEVKLNRNYMFSNYVKIAWRNLARNKVSSFINIGGLAVGMAVAIFIGLWLNDELSFNKYHTNYTRIAQVLEKDMEDGETSVIRWVPYPLEAVLRNKYGSNFKQVVLTMGADEQILSFAGKSVFQVGKYMQPGGPEMLSLRMLQGRRNGLDNPSSILLSATAAKALFGSDDPMGKTLQINNKQSVQVTGVYEDIPYNSDFKDVNFIAPWDLLVANTNWIKNAKTEWGNTSFSLYVELQPNTTIKSVSGKIKNSKAENIPAEPNSTCEILLDPMKNWHLYSEWKNGVNTGGRIQYIWLFGIIGAFVLVLACINFMNLSTARCEKRAKEVGIRKAVGSLRSQLVKQFLGESLLVSALAAVLAFILVGLGLPWFNSIAGAQISFPFQNPLFWLGSIGFVLLTGLLAGSYPALYLSSFQPVKVLKGAFSAGRFSSLFRRSLTVLQFSVSIALIIGTAFVYRQVQYVKSRPVGYNRDNLLMVRVKSPDIAGKLDVLQTALKNNPAVASVAAASGPLTDIWATGGGFSWRGMPPNADNNFAKVWITEAFGKTVGWQFVAGRDFSAAFGSDSMPAQSNTGVAYSAVINEAAAKNMGLRNPVGETIRWSGQPLTIIGVIKDMVMQSPYEPAKQTIYLVNNTVARDWVNIRIQPGVQTGTALAAIEGVFKKIAPSVPFEYKFADTEYGLKFLAEERIQKLAFVFGTLAIFISCLGLFGLASFMAEKRTKEIGMRKVLGASVLSIWRLLSTDFIKLVLLSCIIAVPVAYLFIYRWLQNYTYHTALTWWVFALAAVAALVITLLTVSYQSIKTGLINPVKSLKAE